MVIAVGCSVLTHTLVVEYPYSSLTVATTTTLAALTFSVRLHVVAEEKNNLGEMVLFILVLNFNAFFFFFLTFFGGKVKIMWIFFPESVEKGVLKL